MTNLHVQLISLTDPIMILLLLTNFALLGSSRLHMYIRLVALQGFLLGILPLLAAHDGGTSIRELAIVGVSIGVKGIALPLMLSRAIRAVGIKREVEPYVDYSLSVILGMAILGFSIWTAGRLPVPASFAATLTVPTSLFTILTGLFLVVSRRKAITHAIGYLVFENGVYAFGAGLVQEVPFLIELGILLDVFAGVFIMGITIFHIRQEFDDIDTGRLSALQEGTPEGSES